MDGGRRVCPASEFRDSGVTLCVVRVAICSEAWLPRARLTYIKGAQRGTQHPSSCVLEHLECRVTVCGKTLEPASQHRRASAQRPEPIGVGVDFRTEWDRQHAGTPSHRTSLRLAREGPLKA
eukprot:3149149-Prymnesium_polylepis.1